MELEDMNTTQEFIAMPYIHIIKALTSSQWIQQASTSSRNACRHQCASHWHPRPTLITNCTKQESHANTDCNGANICSPSIMWAQVQIVLTLKGWLWVRRTSFPFQFVLPLKHAWAFHHGSSHMMVHTVLFEEERSAGVGEWVSWLA